MRASMLIAHRGTGVVLRLAGMSRQRKISSIFFPLRPLVLRYTAALSMQHVLIPRGGVSCDDKLRLLHVPDPIGAGAAGYD